MERKIVVADEKLLSEVLTVGRAELCNSDGQTVGFALSTDQYALLRRDAGEVEFTPEYLAEINRCVAEGKYKTTAEVLEMLARLDKAISGDT